MVIGIDIRILGSQHGGIAEYASRLIEEMIVQAPEHQFKLLYSSLQRSLPEYPWFNNPNVRVYKFHIPNNMLFTANRFFGWPCLDELMGGADVFFSPHFFVASISSKCRHITTYHDLSFERFPEFFTWSKRFWHKVRMNPAVQARLSDKVIAVSESTKSDLTDLYHIDPSHVSVISSGVSITRPSEKELLEFKEHNNLPDIYILALSTLEPRKNIEGIIEAFNILKNKSEFEDVELLIVGGTGWNYGSIIKAINSSPFHSQIRNLGFVHSGDRAKYYSLASVFVYPSFFEGFGFPILEAMSCATPVLTSLNSSLPEVGGNAPLYIDPYNINDIAEGLKTLLTNSEICARCIKNGSIQSSKFNWRLCAQETLALLIHS